MCSRKGRRLIVVGGLSSADVGVEVEGFFGNVGPAEFFECHQLCPFTRAFQPRPIRQTTGDRLDPLTGFPRDPVSDASGPENVPRGLIGGDGGSACSQAFRDDDSKILAATGKE